MPDKTTPEAVSLLRVGNAEWLIHDRLEQPIRRTLDSGRPPVDYDIGPLPAADDPDAENRRDAIERASARMPHDDGDDIEEGYHVIGDDGERTRVGDAMLLTGWHGTSQPTDTTVDLEKRAPHADGRERLRDVPAVYASFDPIVAEGKAFAQTRFKPEESPQLYELAIAPSEIVEAGTCEDATSVLKAIDDGADVLLCPDWKARGTPVREVVILNDEVHQTAQVIQADDLLNYEITDVEERSEQRLRSNPDVSKSFYRNKQDPKFRQYKNVPHPYMKKGR